MINSTDDIKNFIKDKNFKKIFILCGKKSFITSGAEVFFKTLLDNKEIYSFNKSSELPILDELIKIIQSDKPLHIQGESGDLEIFPNELIVEGIAENGYGISTGKNIVVGISTEISDELKQEGMVRDLIRQVQNLRKDSGLKVEDRIEIGIQGSKELNDAVNSYKSYFMNEVLGVKLEMGNSTELTFNESVKINGEKIIIGISPT